MARAGALGTGSSGNCCYVESGGAVVLVDVGFSAHDAAKRLRSVGLDPAAVAGILVTHEHGDHSKGVATFAARHHTTIFGTRGTLRAVPSIRRRNARHHALEPGWPVAVGPFSVTPFRIPHDAADPVGFLLEADGRTIAVTTDIGHVTAEVRAYWRRADVLMVESNHDIDMLRVGPYPERLKERVASDVGHLSNDALAQFLAERAPRPLSQVLLTHLSKINNEPALAARTAHAALRGTGVTVQIALQDEPSAVLQV